MRCVSRKFQAEWDCGNLIFLTRSVLQTSPMRPIPPTRLLVTSIRGLFSCRLWVCLVEVGGRSGVTDWECLKESSHHASRSLGSRQPPPADSSRFPYSSQLLISPATCFSCVYFTQLFWWIVVLHYTILENAATIKPRSWKKKKNMEIENLMLFETFFPPLHTLPVFPEIFAPLKTKAKR